MYRLYNNYVAIVIWFDLFDPYALVLFGFVHFLISPPRELTRPKYFLILFAYFSVSFLVISTRFPFSANSPFLASHWLKLYLKLKFLLRFFEDCSSRAKNLLFCLQYCLVRHDSTCRSCMIIAMISWSCSVGLQPAASKAQLHGVTYFLPASNGFRNLAQKGSRDLSVSVYQLSKGVFHDHWVCKCSHLLTTIKINIPQ